MKQTKVKFSKDSDLCFKTHYCEICDRELFRTIENPMSDYYSPAMIIHCKQCEYNYIIKYDLINSLSITLINKARKIIGKY